LLLEVANVHVCFVCKQDVTRVPQSNLWSFELVVTSESVPMYVHSDVNIAVH